MKKTKQKNRANPNMKSWATLLVGIGLVILGVVSALWLGSLPAQSAANGGTISVVPQPVEFIAPDLALTDLQGRAVTLAGLRGQVVMVNNWATWCPPCKAEMPTLQAYYDQHKDAGFVLVGINSGDAAADVSAFVQQFGLTFPVWLDPSSQALSAFRNDALPSSYVIDAIGMVRLAWTGAISQDMLEEYITPLLED